MEKYIPVLLTTEERNNPYLVLEKFFVDYPLPGLLDLVQQHMKVVLSAKQCRKLKPLDIVIFYENIERLFEATHMLKLRYDSLMIMQQGRVKK